LIGWRNVSRIEASRPSNLRGSGVEQQVQASTGASVATSTACARRRGAEARHPNELRITGKGKRTLTELRRYVVEREAKVTKGLSSDDVKLLNGLLTKIASINS
jgi:hypothetical protein